VAEPIHSAPAGSALFSPFVRDRLVCSRHCSYSLQPSVGFRDMIAGMVRFGPFTVSFSDSEVRKHGIPVRMAEQPFRVLQTLLEQPGKVVSREELHERLWASDTFVDFERGLNAAVAKLRTALNDSADQPLYVETVARKGYRFIAPLAQEATTSPLAGPILPSVPVIARKWVVPVSVALALFITVLTLSFGTWRKARAGAVRPLSQVDIEVGDEVSQPAVSPDGARIVFSTSNGLAVRRLDDTNITLLKNTQGASLPFFSPDGRSVGFFAGRKLMKVTIDGGAVVNLCDAPLGGGASWGEDHTIIAALNSTGGLSRIPDSGGSPQPFTEAETGMNKDNRGTSHRLPHVLPAGHGTLFMAGDGRAEGALRVQPPNGAAAKTLVEGAAGGRYLSSGHLVYFKHGTLFAAGMDIRRLVLTGPASPLVDGVSLQPSRSADFDVSFSGTLVYRKGGAAAKRKLVWLNSSGAKESVGFEPAGYLTPRLSPDGKRIALVLDSDGQTDLWAYHLPQGKTRLTFDGERKCCPVWTPNGEFLLFSSKGALAWVRADGGGKVERVSSSDTNTAPWSISHDGKWLTFHRTEPKTGTDVSVVPLEQVAGILRVGESRPLVRQAGIQAAPSLSPDGQWMVYSSDESGQRELYVIPFSPEGPERNGRWQASNESIMSPRWCPECEAIFYRGGMDRKVRLLLYKISGNTFIPGKSRIWAEQQISEIGHFPNFDVAPDGTRVLAVIEQEGSRTDETHLRLMLNVGDELTRRFAVH
jgi:Tol biopolymer transport system component/DNA-binding winged helix-turn-helix (wHTH) protein